MPTDLRSIPLAEYLQLVEATDKMPPEIHPLLFGLYGEVGSVMATSKKHHREQGDYIGFRTAVVEEFGDVLWYFAAIGRRLELSIDLIFAAVAETAGFDTAVVASDLAERPLAMANRVTPTPELDPALLALGSRPHHCSHSVAATCPPRSR